MNYTVSRKIMISMIILCLTSGIAACGTSQADQTRDQENAVESEADPKVIEEEPEEKEPEVLEAVREVAEKLLEAYDNVYLQVDFGSMHTVSPERLVRIVDYTLNGLLTEMVREPGFRPDAYYREAILYLEELEKLCVQAGDGDGMD